MLGSLEGGRSDRQGFKRARDLSIIPITDYSIEDTPYDDPEISYFRLIGRGEHNIYQFIDQELVEIRERGESRKSKKVYLSFHGDFLEKVRRLDQEIS